MWTCWGAFHRAVSTTSESGLVTHQAPGTDPARRSPGAGPGPSPTLASSTSVGSQAANAKVDEEEALQLLDKATPAELAAQARALERARSTSLARRLAREERNAKKPRVLEPPPYTPPVLGVASCSCLQQPCPVHADPKSFKYHHDMSRMRSHSWVRTVRLGVAALYAFSIPPRARVPPPRRATGV